MPETVRLKIGRTGFEPAIQRIKVRCEYRDLVETGAVDPGKLVHTALQNGASIGGLILKANATVTESAKK
ncbi:hypothetical protein [Caballeronia mineralivorans]|uniref:hypothetical protein n=1 Tax=Caballeronia mineralivorans TaxID=2010198 RepID=UPI0023F1424A|nr:hypothetical protein [Caballeronia mineralivorans]MDB5788178.1 groL [Caballeronia mineralivorans]MEA3101156.1 chaperonin GroEL [Caballeronia mineralivorans]